MPKSSNKVLVGISGGFDGVKPFDSHDYFLVVVESVLGDAIRSDVYTAMDMWNALVNKAWTHPITNTELCYSYRAAGDLIATIVGEKTYLDWYCCCSVTKTIDPEIEQALSAKGWSWRNLTEDDLP